MNRHKLRQQRRIKAYPTSSLKEYLAHRSVHQSQPSIQCDGQSIEIEIDIGDGRRQILCLNADTDIDHSAKKFCQKYELEPFVSNLLAQTLREQYQREITQQSNQKIQALNQQLHEIYTSYNANQVLIEDQDISGKKAIEGQTRAIERQNKAIERQTRAIERQTYTYESYDKESLWVPIVSINNDKENAPSINTVSKRICQKYGKENILRMREQRSREKRQAIRRQKQLKEQADLKECHFRPKINSISQKVDRELNDQTLRQDKKVQRYKLLYENHHQLQAKRVQLEERTLAEHPYKPHINPISRLIVQNKEYGDSLSVSKQTSHTHCIQPDPQLLRPKTGRKPQNRNKRGLPIGQYLYQQGRRHSKPEIETKSQFKALEHSQFLVATLKEKKLKQIFIELTQPPHEQLLPSDLPYSYEIFQGPLRLLLPLFIQIQQLGVALSLDNFLQAGLRLIESLSPDERHQLMFKKINLATETPSSYDSIRSRGMSRKSSGDLYARSMVMTREKENKLQRSRQKKVRQELKKCTFRPILHR